MEDNPYVRNKFQSTLTTLQRLKRLGQQDRTKLPDPAATRGYHFQSLGQLVRTAQNHDGTVRHQGRILYQRQMDARPHRPIPSIILCGPEEACKAWLGKSS